MLFISFFMHTHITHAAGLEVDDVDNTITKDNIHEEGQSVSDNNPTNEELDVNEENAQVESDEEEPNINIESENCLDDDSDDKPMELTNAEEEDKGCNESTDLEKINEEPEQ